MRRPMSLGVWPSTFLLTWLAISTTIFLYIPFELARIPQETLVNLPASNILAKYPGLVHRLISGSSHYNTDLSPAHHGMLPSSNANCYATAQLQDDCMNADEPIVFEPAKAAEVDPGAVIVGQRSTLSTFTSLAAQMAITGAMAHLIQPTLVPLPSRVSVFLHNPTVIKAAWYALISRWVLMTSHDIYLWYAANQSCNGNLASPQESKQGPLHSGNCSPSRMIAPFRLYWNRVQRLLCDSIVNRYLFSNKYLSKYTPACACERDQSVISTTQDKKSGDTISPPIPTSHILPSKVTPGRPEPTGPSCPRVHDCGIDDPNWKSFFSLGSVQYRHCRPTYTEWRPEDYLVPKSEAGFADNTLFERVYFSFGSSVVFGKPAKEPKRKGHALEAAELVFGFPRSDPRNRYINMNPRFAPCREDSPQILVIFGSSVDRICQLDEQSPFDRLHDLAIENLQTVFPSRITAQFMTATASTRQPAPVPHGVVKRQLKISSSSLSHLNSWFRSLVFVVLLLVACVSYFAIQAILAPMYAPFIRNALAPIPFIGRYFQVAKSADVVKDVAQRRNSSSRHAEFRLSHRESSRVGKWRHPSFRVVKSPPRLSVFGLFPEVPISGGCSPFTAASEEIPLGRRQDAVVGIDQRTPITPVQVARMPPAAPRSTPRIRLRRRLLTPEAISLDRGSLDPSPSLRQLDKGKGVDRSAPPTTANGQTPIHLSTGPNPFYTPTQTGASCSSSTVNVPRLDSVHAVTSQGSSGPGPLLAANDGAEMQLDEEGWPIKPRLRTPECVQSLEQVNQSQQPEASTSDASDLQKAEVFFDENCLSEVTPRAAPVNKRTATRGFRRPLTNLDRVPVEAPEIPSAPCAASSLPRFSQPIDNPPITLGMRLQPYYDTEEDDLRHARELEARELREAQRAEREEMKLLQPAKNKTPQPRKVDPLPCGARLPPLRD
ncbi:hypothetical protein NliqN6_3536 [Naganishia liquefaciens]|uniref:Transmembrane protein n=1 Tax=Naganishia liquefaciens TaxID=104408 RepID=A0A8H3TU78_9TREE|nr:hypothetical protein NliqN6_3536 [Naganishia liquefaciens]